VLVCVCVCVSTQAPGLETKPLERALEQAAVDDINLI